MSDPGDEDDGDLSPARSSVLYWLSAITLDESCAMDRRFYEEGSARMMALVKQWRFYARGSVASKERRVGR